MHKVVFFAALLAFFTPPLHAGAVDRGLDQTERRGYRPGVLVLQFTEEAVKAASFSMQRDRQGMTRTGLVSVDALVSKYGVSSINRDGMYQPRNANLARAVGEDRIYYAYLPVGVDVENAAKEFSIDLSIAAANPDWEVYPTAIPNDPLHANHWGHNNTAQMPAYNWSTGQHNGPPVGLVGFDAKAHNAWDGTQGYGNSSVIIAIIDGGVNWSHPDLRIWVNDDPIDGIDNDANGYVDDIRGWDFGSNDNNPDDNATNAGHGTACAGVAAAIANNSIGVAGIAGGATIMPLKAANNAGTMYYSYINSAVYYAADNGAHIISMSLGSSGQDAANNTACTYAWNAGSVVLAATGNENKTTISYPAGNTNVIAVGAASPCGERKRSSNLSTEVNPGVSTDPNGYTCDGERWWGSNYGSTTQNAATAVEVIAPTILPTTDILGSGGYASGDYSLYFNGTSCATPYAAGVCALIRSKNPSWTPAQVRDQLRSTARDVVSVESGAGWDRHSGYGMVDAAAAVGAGAPVTPTITVTKPNGGESWVVATSQNITWNSTGTIANIKIEYSTNSGSSWSTIASSTGNTGSYAWTIPATPTSTGLVRVSDAAAAGVNDVSNNTFSITSAPSRVTIFSEDFEVTTVPGGPWTAYDDNGSSGRDYWGDQSVSSGARVFSGSWSAYCADNSNSSGQTYDHNMNSYMAHSGVGISGHSAAEVSFYIWYKTYNSSDYVSFQYFNGSSWIEFSGGRYSGTGTGSQIWAQKTFSVPAAAGTSFRFRWIFFSNGSSKSEGAYIDNIVVSGIPLAPSLAAPNPDALTSTVPTEFALLQNFPNPFNPATTITYQIAQEGPVSLKVFDLLGRDVATLINEPMQPGRYSVRWDATGFTSGAYFYRLTTPGYSETKKLVLMK